MHNFKPKVIETGEIYKIQTVIQTVMKCKMS